MKKSPVSHKIISYVKAKKNSVRCALTGEKTYTYQTTDCGQMIDTKTYNRIQLQPNPCCPFCRDPIPPLSQENQFLIMQSASTEAQDLYQKIPRQYAQGITQKMLARFSRENEMEAIGGGIAKSLFTTRRDIPNVHPEEMEAIISRNASRNFNDFLAQLPANCLEDILGKMSKELSNQLLNDTPLVVSIIVEETRQQSALALKQATAAFSERFIFGFSKTFLEILRHQVN